MERLTSLIDKIAAPDFALAEEAQARLDNLTKPRGSLGRLEDLARHLCVVRGTVEITPPKPAAAVFAADHGVCKSGVSLYPPEVTAQMVFNFLNGGAGINVLGRQAGATVTVVDVGVDFDFGQPEGLVAAKVARGTANMAEEPAMTTEQVLAAIAVGAKVADDLMDRGYDLLIPGDMGIGNTTASAALTAVFCDKPVAKVTGRGTGLDDASMLKKVAVIEQTIAMHGLDQSSDPLEVLRRIGGLEIAAICGYCLAAAARRVPVMLDGFISTSGALAAVRLCPPAVHYFFAGHSSVEAGHRAQLAHMGLIPILDLNLRLGEGTGAALATQMLTSAVAIYREMATFDSAGVTGEETQPA